MVKSKGKGHSPWNPHLWTTIAFLAGLHSSLKDTPAKQTSLKLILDRWKGLSNEGRMDTMKFFRIIGCYSRSKKKLALSWGPGQRVMEWRAVANTLLASLPEVKHKQGRPPAGYMERELSLWLKSLIGKD